ncbi:hypothetical protein [Rhodoluna lacicola]|uniref:Uncharacterized protein n=1 Tax=Rhodoluna lacicola TaxID=529884 RepID=A0A060JK01_9MICO|nr:hypothetical protein [Rhodoluna lacicola]AIC46948.1 hypothetical protein Rhola_00001180 [Rhodoluna lacicola]
MSKFNDSLRPKKFQLGLDVEQLRMVGEIVLLASSLEWLIAKASQIDFYSSKSHSPVDYGQQRVAIFKALNMKLKDFEENSRLHKLTNWRQLSGDMKRLLDVRDTVVHGSIDHSNPNFFQFINVKDGTSVSAEITSLEHLKNEIYAKVELLVTICEVLQKHDTDSGEWAVYATKNKK